MYLCSANTSDNIKKGAPIGVGAVGGMLEFISMKYNENFHFQDYKLTLNV